MSICILSIRSCNFCPGKSHEEEKVLCLTGLWLKLWEDLHSDKELCSVSQLRQMLHASIKQMDKLPASSA